MTFVEKTEIEKPEKSLLLEKKKLRKLVV